MLKGRDHRRLDRLFYRPWYDLGSNINQSIAFPERCRLRHIVFYNPERVSLNKNLYGVEPFNPEISICLSIILNSTLTALISEVYARQPGGGGGPLDIDVYVAALILVPNIDLIMKYKDLLNDLLLDREIESIFEEIGADNPDDVNFEKIKQDRRKLDKIIMGDILGLTEDEQLEVYRAVVDLVKYRIEKAQSAGSSKKMKGGIDVELLKKVVVEQIKKES